MLELGQTLRGENNAEKIEEIDTWLLMQQAPGNFDIEDPGNDQVQQEKRFETICVLLEDSGVSSPTHQTVFAFYTRIAYLQEKNKPKK